MHNSTAKWIIRSAFWVLALLAFSYPFIYPPKPLLPDFEEQQLATGIPDFQQMTNVVAKKRAFFDYLLPEVENQNSIILEQRHWLLSLQRKAGADYQLTHSERRKLESLIEQYKVTPADEPQQLLQSLLTRVDIVPVELVLMQAANESAWGTSRFARLGYNFFGMWCFKPGCGFVPARRPEGAINEVAKFPDLAYAVRTYLTNLNRHYAYEEFRAIRRNMRLNQQPITAEALAQGLMSYSERGQDYIDELLDMMRVNRKYIQI